MPNVFVLGGCDCKFAIGVWDFWLGTCFWGKSSRNQLSPQETHDLSSSLMVMVLSSSLMFEMDSKI